MRLYLDADGNERIDGAYNEQTGAFVLDSEHGDKFVRSLRQGESFNELEVEPVALEGWSLSDNRRKLLRWQFPSVTLPANGYLAVHCSGLDRRDDPAHLHTSFRISNKGDDVFLTDANGNTVSHVHTPAMEPDQSYSLLETGWSRQFLQSITRWE